MKLREFLNLSEFPSHVDFEVLEEVRLDKFCQQLIKYRSLEGDWIFAYMLIPASSGPHPAIIVHHQHNGERHFGKSEVIGLAGNPLQAFGPSLAGIGYVVLAPDSICFEDRRSNKKGIEQDSEEADWLQHFNEMTYRLVNGDSLMRKVLDDAGVGVSLLTGLPFVVKNQIGVFGHSYGGNTALFQGATDDRIQFVCASGALCSYKHKIDAGTGLEMALVVPDIALHSDFDKILSVIAPREVLIVSAEEDKYSKDAVSICEAVKEKFTRTDGSCKLSHFRDRGGHAMTKQRFQTITDWVRNIYADEK